MRDRLNNSGFTLMETLAVVTIIVIMAGLVFVSVISYQKTLTQFEYDGKAREIFVAAQNHLTMMESQGLLQQAKNEHEGEGDENAALGFKGSGGERYFAVNGKTDSRLQSANTSVLYMMLPFASIDETVRRGGSYVIKYDLDSAAILGVFYTEASGWNLGGLSSGEACAGLFSDYAGDDKKAKRRNDQKGVLGWYGNGDALPHVTLEAPEIWVENAERLRVHVTNPNSAITSASLKLIITGKTSGAEASIALTGRLGNIEVAESGGFYVDLDDVTVSGRHFAELFGIGNAMNTLGALGAPSASGVVFGDDKRFIPGEDIFIQAEASSTSSLSNIPRSVRLQRNSLFESVVDVQDAETPTAPTVRTARVSSIRHLENLDESVSGFASNSIKNAAEDGSAEQTPITAAGQTADLSWITFSTVINPSSPDAVSVLKLKQTETKATYVPVSLEQNFSYYGDVSGQDDQAGDVSASNALSKISDIAALANTGEGSAGVFGSLTGGTIKNLELVNCQTGAVAENTGTVNAGALAGAVSGVTISNVLVRNEPAGESTDASLEITGSGSVGGLVGSMQAGSIKNCAAAVYVRSSGGVAGGLVGQAVNGSISNSYSGGHTSEGKYGTALFDPKADPVVGRMNVQGATAGGFVGATNGTTISNCYSTCSAHGSSVAGGFVGSVTAGSITNCYATGLVSGTTKGTFVGSRSDGTWNGNQYLSIINYDSSKKDEKDKQLPAVGGGNDANQNGVSAIDEDMAAYRLFVNAATGNAVCYDSTLSTRYSSSDVVKYPYKNIDNLSGSNSSGDPLSVHLMTHFGDWPSPGVLVVNANT